MVDRILLHNLHFHYCPPILDDIFTCGQLNDKMGRLETDDLLNQITNQLTEKLRRAGKEMQVAAQYLLLLCLYVCSAVKTSARR